jgi:hypothetical protein
MSDLRNDTFGFLERELDKFKRENPRIILPHEVRRGEGAPLIQRIGSRELPESLVEKAERVGFFRGRVEVKGVIEMPDERPRVAFYHADNTITFDAREVMAHAIAGEDDAAINTVAWGADGRQPSREDPDLYDPRITSAVTQVSYPTPESVIFSSSLPPGVGTGLQLREVGLKSAGGVLLATKLFARFVFPQQEKFDRLRLSVNWQIIFI